VSVGDGALVDASPAHESADVDASSGKVASLWRPAFAVPAACGGLCDATRVLSMMRVTLVALALSGRTGASCEDFEEPGVSMKILKSRRDRREGAEAMAWQS
jgi:hypothetical protein